MVPNGWEKSDLTHLITIKHGFAFKSEFYSDKGQYVLLTPGSFYETEGFVIKK
jgi:type I restriction enzyme S subunit